VYFWPVRVPVTYASAFLRRNVRIDCYLPDGGTDRLLLVNDGQDLEAMDFDGAPGLFCVGIHAGRDRIQEYGTAIAPDYRGRGSRAFLYTHFIVQELLPFLQENYPYIAERAFAGFSLGGLSALDIVWNHPHLFRTAAVFSGSLWWRSKSYEEGYVDERDRIMHAQIRSRNPGGQRFFFECGTRDETEDRNGNGVIDSIDDTLDLIAALRARGVPEESIRYLEIPGGRHDRDTWAEALPEFIRWNA